MTPLSPAEVLKDQLHLKQHREEEKAAILKSPSKGVGTPSTSEHATPHHSLFGTKADICEAIAEGRELYLVLI